MNLRTVLVVGATGSIGVHVVRASLDQGYTVRALVRDAARANRQLPDGTQLVVGDLTDPGSLHDALAGVDAVVFTHGSNGGPAENESVDYGAVRNILTALDGRKVRIALMTSIGVTEREGSYNRSTRAHDWKRRSERLLRVSGNSYTIVRPGWFDYNTPGQRRIVMLQGDTRRAGTSADGVIARDQIARVLVDSLSLAGADHKTLELVAEEGPAQEDLEPEFAALAADTSLDGAADIENMPLDDEPASVRHDLEALTGRTGAVSPAEE